MNRMFLILGLAIGATMMGLFFDIHLTNIEEVDTVKKLETVRYYQHKYDSLDFEYNNLIAQERENQLLLTRYHTRLDTVKWALIEFGK